MSTQHTPGPWIVEDNPTIQEGKQIAAFSDDGNRALQVIVRTFKPDDLSLIAAAPDLLDALQIMLKHANTMTAKLVAHAAIAKATGEKP